MVLLMEGCGFLLFQVQRAGFSCPTPIQAQSWPIALQGCDVVAIAKTGSGKTIGYLFPGFVHLKRVHNNSKMGPTVLVLSPTRELATQIQDEAEKFGRSSRISCTVSMPPPLPLSSSFSLLSCVYVCVLAWIYSHTRECLIVCLFFCFCLVWCVFVVLWVSNLGHMCNRYGF